MRLKTYLLLSLIGIVVFLILELFLIDDLTESQRNRNLCKAEQRALELNLNGTISDKYRDNRNHNVKTIEINSINKNIKATFLAIESSGFYDIISVGDSLIKEEGTLEIKIIRDGIQKMYQLNFACD